MRTITLPYLDDNSRYLEAISQENGLIWFHSGERGQNTEWFSCWPSATFAYLGDGEITKTDYKNRITNINGDWFSVLKEHFTPLKPLSRVYLLAVWQAILAMTWT